MKIEVPDKYARLLPDALALMGLKLTGEFNHDRSWQTAPLPTCEECGRGAPLRIGDHPYCVKHYAEEARREGLL